MSTQNHPPDCHCETCNAHGSSQAMNVYLLFENAPDYINEVKLHGVYLVEDAAVQEMDRRVREAEREGLVVRYQDGKLDHVAPFDVEFYIDTMEVIQ